MSLHVPPGGHQKFLRLYRHGPAVPSLGDFFSLHRNFGSLSMPRERFPFLFQWAGLRLGDGLRYLFSCPGGSSNLWWLARRTGGQGKKVGREIARNLFFSHVVAARQFFPISPRGVQISGAFSKRTGGAATHTIARVSERFFFEGTSPRNARQKSRTLSRLQKVPRNSGGGGVS